MFASFVYGRPVDKARKVVFGTNVENVNVIEGFSVEVVWRRNTVELVDVPSWELVNE